MSFADHIASRLRLGALREFFRNTGAAQANLPLGAVPFVLKFLQTDITCFYVARDEIEAEEIHDGILSLGGESFFFPDIDVIPYSGVFPSGDKLGDRVRTLYEIRKGKPAAVVLTVESFLRKLPPLHALDRSCLEFRKGETVDRDALPERFTAMSYIRDYKVTQPGAFSVRGDIIDIFPPDKKDAVRINLFGNEIESVKIFNPLTQMSVGTLDGFTLIPASEFALEKDRVADQDRDYLPETHSHSYFTKFYDTTARILDFCPGPALVVYSDSVLSKIPDVMNRYETSRPERAEVLLHDWDAMIASPQASRRLELTGAPVENSFGLNIKSPPEFGEGFTRFVSDLETVYFPGGYRVFILVEYQDLADRLANMLKKFAPARLKPGDEADPNARLSIAVLDYEHGFEVRPEGEPPLLVLTEGDLSGKKRLFRKRIRQIDTFIEDIEQIGMGETVVHLNYGIGLFRGVERVNVLGKEKDYILLEFAEKEKLYVPLEQSHLIGKYIGGNKKGVLDSLGGKSWAKKRDRVRASVEAYAKKLVAIYARRTATSGHAFAKDTVWQKEFEDKFEYIETPDQVKVISEIKTDMESARPMDRLLCGDVGFGKTEVAMRAAFKAVMDGRQVALVAPTTVLVEQHYYTFRERFAGFPVTVEFVSRFTTSDRLAEAVRALENRKIDILIGTHKLFSEALKFPALGLVIIDEEHKFGVGQKEILKERHPYADFLSLSATPIPRTLNMALATIRDISLLQTPPDMRIPVETLVSDFSMDVVKYALEKELSRGGQAFFVHNTIKRLPEYAYQIERLIPGAKVAVGHGQMDEAELDRSFMGFVRGEFDVFVCTTIIDSGLDIPNANTIIVSDSHRFGLSQLYQLKGRVGRAKKQGFAYFLYPERRALTETAQKRLYVLSEYTDLGAGFHIAMQDLEIRGAGNILGHEQHGNIVAVGYEVYMRLLREEVDKLKGTWREKVDTVIDLNYDAFIPDAYVADSPVKMEVYRKILSVKGEEDIRALHDEFLDRFGPIPQEVTTLFEISRLKMKAEALSIRSILEKGTSIEMEFSKYSRVDAARVMKVRESGKHDIRVLPHEKDKIFYKSFDSGISVKVRRLNAFLDEIAEKTAGGV